MSEALRLFFANRTIGYVGSIGWTWRGQGYDEGWDTPTELELRALHRLLGEHLNDGRG